MEDELDVEEIARDAERARRMTSSTQEERVEAAARVRERMRLHDAKQLELLLDVWGPS